MIDDIWYNNISNLFEVDKLMNFFPNEEMSLEEKLNSALRFTLYFSVIVYLVNRTFYVFYLVLIMAGITYIVYSANQKENFLNDDDEYLISSLKKTAKSGRCSVPQKTNPFMNVLMNDYVHNPKRPEACDVSKPVVEKKVKQYFENDLYMNIDDVFNKNSSYRQFYTTPSTTIPNDQEGFAKWLYFSEDKTCKEGNTQKCYR